MRTLTHLQTANTPESKLVRLHALTPAQVHTRLAIKMEHEFRSIGIGLGKRARLRVLNGATCTLCVGANKLVI